MPTTQPAVVNFSAQKGAVELRQVPVPDIGPDDVLLEVQAVGVCGSDLHMWQFCQSWPVNYPCVLGHEFGGVIRKLGERVTGWREGMIGMKQGGTRRMYIAADKGYGTHPPAGSNLSDNAELVIEVTLRKVEKH